MAHVIAVAGKGGVGKTVKYLNEVLGVEMPVTLGEIREEIERAGSDPQSRIPASMPKKEYLEYRIEDALVEEKDYDLMVMGRSQGAGCYCFI